MKRSVKPRKVGVMPWLIGLVLVGGGLVGLFSLGRASWLRQVPGLHIGDAEWRAYQALFDRHPASSPDEALPLLRFGKSREVPECIEAQRGGAWRARWFEGDGYGDSVDVRNMLDRRGYVVRFRKSAPYQEQRRIMLTPATADAFRAKQLEVMARELGLITPGLSLARVLSCGQDLGLHVQQEWVDAAFLHRHGLRGVSLLKLGMDPSRPDQQFPVIAADSAEQVKLRGILERAYAEAAMGNTAMLAGLVDERAAAAWALMAWVDGRDLREAPFTFTYDWANGRFSPIYQTPVTSGSTGQADALLFNPVTPLFKLPAFKARFERLQAEAAEKWSALQQQHAAVFAQWSALAGAKGMPVFPVSHITDNRAVAYLDRALLPGPGHATFVHGMALPPVAVNAAAGVDTLGLAQLAKRHKLILRGDSIIFPRGKYMIEEDIEFPAGRTVLLLEGARLFMAPARSILVKGDLFVEGTLRNPVFIRPQDEGRPFGAIAVLGGASQQCAISGLYISGGAGAKLAGMPCDGMLTVIGALRTSIASSVFQENTAQSSLKVDGGELEMNEVRFTDAAKCFAHLDQVRGVLRDLVMVGARTNGTTGLHIGTGTLAVLGGTYTNLAGDAIRCDGAAQVLVRNARLAGNGTALRSEGRAEVHVEGCTIDGNGASFATDAGTPGDRIILYANQLSGNKAGHDAEGGIRQKPALDQATAVLFGVPVVQPDAEGQRRRRGSRSGSSD